MRILNLTGEADTLLLGDLGVVEICPDDSEYVEKAYSFSAPPTKGEVEFRCEALVRLVLFYQAEKVLVDPPKHMVRELARAMEENSIECFVLFGEGIVKL